MSRLVRVGREGRVTTLQQPGQLAGFQRIQCQGKEDRAQLQVSINHRA